MNDGSSSAKTLDEKELFLLKTAATGEPRFALMSLEEPENANTEGLKVAMENAFDKLELTIDRHDHELDLCLCSDGVMVWCPSHRLELVIGILSRQQHLIMSVKEVVQM